MSDDSENQHLLSDENSVDMIVSCKRLHYFSRIFFINMQFLFFGRFCIIYFEICQSYESGGENNIQKEDILLKIDNHKQYL